MKRLLVLLVCTAACSKVSREAECIKSRDRQLIVQEANVKAAVEGADPHHKADIEAEGSKEIEQFRTRFVGFCKNHANVDLACLEDKEKRKSDACKAALKPMWQELYAH